MQQLHWQFDEEQQHWRSEVNGLQAVIEANMENRVYIATVRSLRDEQPITIAPQSFEDLDEARQWCEQIVNSQAMAEEQIAQAFETGASIS